MRTFASKCGGHFYISRIHKILQITQDSDRTVNILKEKKDMKNSNHLPSAITINSQNKD